MTSGPCPVSSPETGMASTWMFNAAVLAEITTVLHDEPWSTRLYESLAPYRGQVVAVMNVQCLGSVDRHLGMLATVLGRGEEAAKHFERALTVDTRLRAPT